jgi:hypothetical protein
MDAVKTISLIQIKKISFCVIDVLAQSATTEQTEEKENKNPCYFKILKFFLIFPCRKDQGEPLKWFAMRNPLIGQ